MWCDLHLVELICYRGEQEPGSTPTPKLEAVRPIALNL